MKAGPCASRHLVGSFSPTRASRQRHHLLIKSFVTVPHRCFRPAIDETCKRVGVECFRVVGTEVGMSLVRISPCNSRTRNPLSTPDCRHGRFTAPEHAF